MSFADSPFFKLYTDYPDLTESANTADTRMDSEARVAAYAEWYADLIVDRVNLQQKGAPSDNTGDASPVLQDVLQKMADGTYDPWLYVPAGHYRMLSKVNVTLPVGKRIRVTCHPDAVFDFGTITTPGTSGDQNVLIGIWGPGDTAFTNLSADALLWDSLLTVPSGSESNWTPNSFARIVSNDIYDPSTIAGTLRYKVGELLQVQSTGSGVLNLYGSIRGWDNYATSDIARVSRLDFAGPVIWEGGRIIGGGHGLNQAAFGGRYIRGLRVEGVYVAECDYYSFALSDCLSPLLTDIEADQTNNPVTEGFGYGVHLSGVTTDAVVENSEIRYGRHAVSTGTTTIGTTTPGGMPMNQRLSHFTARHQTSNGIDTHGIGSLIVLDDFTSIDAGQYGLDLRQSRVIINGGYIFANHDGPAMMLRNQSDVIETDWNVGDFIIDGSPENGIQVQFPDSEDALVGTQAGRNIKRINIHDGQISNINRGGSNPEALYIKGDSDTDRMYNVSISNVAMDGGQLRLRFCRDSILGGGISVTSCPDALAGVWLDNCNDINATAGGTVRHVSGSGASNHGIRVYQTGQGNDIEGWSCDGASGIIVDNGVTDCIVSGNDFRRAASAGSLGTGTGHVSEGNRHPGIPASQSAATSVSLTRLDRFHRFTGTTPIENITPRAAGQFVFLKFETAGAKIKSGGTAPAGFAAIVPIPAHDNVALAAGDVLPFMYDGTVWRELKSSLGTGPTLAQFSGAGTYTFTVPAPTPAGLHIRPVGGGGGGGGGGSGNAAQAGGSGAAGGNPVDLVLTSGYSAGDVITVTIATGGGGGAGGVAGGAGSDGVSGGAVTVVNTTTGTTLATAQGGRNGLGSAANSTTAVGGGVIGSTGNNTTTGSIDSGDGGPSAVAGGYALGRSVGGGGGGAASGGLGGGGGGAQTTVNVGARSPAGVAGASADGNGVAGVSATQPCCGGGGGGGGAPAGGNGGNGGAGLPGVCTIWTEA